MVVRNGAKVLFKVMAAKTISAARISNPAKSGLGRGLAVTMSPDYPFRDRVGQLQS